MHQASLPKRDLFYAFKKQAFIRSGKYKLIQKNKQEEGIIELYDLEQDLAEQKDLSLDHPELVDSLKRKLDTWQEEVNKGVKVVSQ